MASYHPSELESNATDSVGSSPRSDHYPHHDQRVRFMCSFGGKILPRPHDNQLRYVGGDTRIVAVSRSTTFNSLLIKLSKLSGIADVSVKYQLPNEDLDALISVTTDEDVENMMEEYERISQNQNPRSARLRLFLFTKGEEPRPGSISSLLDGSANRENWFIDALNSGARLERGRSEASSIVSDVPDYLFGLDDVTDEALFPPRKPKPKTRSNLHDNVSASDPGSPAPVVSSPYCSTSSAVPIVPSIPDLPPVKTKPDNPEPIIEPKYTPVETAEPPVSQPSGYPSNPIMHYGPDSHYSGTPVQQIPVYYVQGPVPTGNIPVQPVQMRAPYVTQYQVQAGQVPVAYQPVPSMGQVYGGPLMRPMMAMEPKDVGRVVPPDGVPQQVYYGVPNARPSMIPGHPGLLRAPGAEDLQRTGSDPSFGRVSQSS